ncbi:MAG TPA: hypothetical protein VLA96_10425 [Terriglobales bacterium]|jgi:chromosome segregation ATPase|nr:hypothetical protein [Terriglobales bacterium]
MKRLWLFLAVSILGAGIAVAQDEGISLGDAARMQREKKAQGSPNGKVYDNENLPKKNTLSTTTGDFGGLPAEDDKDKEGAVTADASAAKGKDKGDKAEKTDEEAAKEKLDEFKGKAADIKKEIDQLNREIDVLNREQRLRAAAYYGDAGAKARPENQAKWVADEKKFQDDLKAKQDDLAAAKQKMTDLQEEIRKAGLNSSIGE